MWAVMSRAKVRPAKIHQVSSTIIPKTSQNASAYPLAAKSHACKLATAS